MAVGHCSRPRSYIPSLNKRTAVRIILALAVERHCLMHCLCYLYIGIGSAPVVIQRHGTRTGDSKVDPLMTPDEPLFTN